MIDLDVQELIRQEGHRNQRLVKAINWLGHRIDLKKLHDDNLI